jgi:SAM-dependent methyltransferase
MGNLLELVTPLHRKTQRDYLARMADDKVACMRIAKQYGPDYWDGDWRTDMAAIAICRACWKPVAQALIDRYNLKPGDKVLDVGCGKAFLLYEMQLLMPGLRLVGTDISDHGLAGTHPDFKGELLPILRQDAYPFGDDGFALAISSATCTILRIFELKTALGEIERVGRNKYVMVESFRNEQELFNLECWRLTAASFHDTAEWIWLYRHFGYTGDYRVHLLQ